MSRRVVCIVLLICASGLTPLAPVGTTTAAADVTATVTPTTPPEGASVEQTFRITFSPESNGTITIELADSYAGGNLTDVTTAAADESVFTDVEASREDGPDGDGRRETIRIQYERGNGTINSTSLSVRATLTHPVVDSDTQLTPTIRHGATTTQAQYTVRNVEQTRAGTEGEFDTRRGTGFVYPNATVFQGEKDLSFAAPLAPPLRRQSDGVPIESGAIRADLPTGTYSNDGTNGTPGITVRNPQITGLTIENARGTDVTGGVAIEETDTTLTVTAEYNFPEAEALELEITNDEGLTVTNELIRGASVKTTGSPVQWTLQIPDEPAAQYRVTVRGSDDLTDGGASQTATIRVADQDTIDLQWEQRQWYQGTRGQLRLRGGQPGARYLVTIDAEEFQSNTTADEMTDSLLETESIKELGVITTDGEVRTAGGQDDLDRSAIARVYAEVSIDKNAEARFRVDTTHLRIQAVTARVFGPDTDPATLAERPEREPVDDGQIRIQRPGIELSAPTEYVINDETTISGTRTPGIDHIVVYVRQPEVDSGFKRVDLNASTDATRRSIDVSTGGGGFSESELTLSAGTGPGNEVLSFPGDRVLAIVGLTEEPTAETAPPTLPASALNSRVSDTKRVTVREAELTLQAIGVNGTVTTVDREFDVQGRAPGADEVLVLVFDQHGRLITDTLAVSDDGTYQKADLAIPNHRRGEIDVIAITSGRDGIFGDGTLPGRDEPADMEAFRAYIQDLRQRNLTTRQLRRLIAEQSFADTGDDDNVRIRTLQLDEPRIRITQIKEAGSSVNDPIRPGETVLISGQTNLQAVNNDLEVLVRGANGRSKIFLLRDWGEPDFLVTFNTAGFGAGQYEIVIETISDVTQTQGRFSVIAPQPPTTTRTPTYELSITTVTETETPTEPSPTTTNTTAVRTRPPTTQDDGAGLGIISTLVGLAAIFVWLSQRKRK